MAEERASQLSSSSVFHSLVLDLECLQRIFVLFIVYSLGWLRGYVWQRRGLILIVHCFICLICIFSPKIFSLNILYILWGGC